MRSFFITIGIFIFISSIDIAFYRKRIFKDIAIKKSILLYLIGFVIDVIILCCILVSNISNDIPYTSLIFYLLLTAVYFLIYTVPYLSAESPSAIILHIISTKGKQKEKEIISHFSNDELITSRLRNMEASSIIEKKNNKYLIGSNGKTLIKLIVFYKKILNW